MGRWRCCCRSSSSASWTSCRCPWASWRARTWRRIATIEGDQLPHISAFIAVASQLILIKSRALLPREPDPVGGARRWARTPRRRSGCGSSSTAATGTRPCGWRRCWRPGARLFHREPSRGRGVGTRRRRRAAAPARWTRARCRGPWSAGSRSRCRSTSRPRSMPRTVTLGDRARVIREALREAPALVLQDLLAGVTRPGGRGHHLPGDAGAGQGPRADRRAGRAVGAHLGPATGWPGGAGCARRRTRPTMTVDDAGPRCDD